MKGVVVVVVVFPQAGYNVLCKRICNQTVSIKVPMERLGRETRGLRGPVREVSVPHFLDVFWNPACVDWGLTRTP